MQALIVGQMSGRALVKGLPVEVLAGEKRRRQDLARPLVAVNGTQEVGSSRVTQMSGVRQV